MVEVYNLKLIFHLFLLTLGRIEWVFRDTKMEKYLPWRNGTLECVFMTM
jgi:hypothetical protein